MPGFGILIIYPAAVSMVSLLAITVSFALKYRQYGIMYIIREWSFFLFSIVFTILVIKVLPTF